MSKFLTVLIVSALLGQEGPAPERTRVMGVPRYGFAIEPPVGWVAGTDKATGLPILVNAPLSKMEDLRRLPDGGAIINVVAWDGLPRRLGDESLSGWAHVDAINAAPGTVTTRAFDVPTSTGISEAIQVSFDEATFGPDDQAQREVSIYWSFRREKFAAHLFYVKGDPKSAEHESVLKETVRSFRPL